MKRNRAQRARLIRRRVIAGALALFVATWLLIAVTLASGHDPALSRTATTKVAGAPVRTATETTTGSTTSTTAATQSEAPSAPSAVTTQQS
jgi:hypothetical protein